MSKAFLFVALALIIACASAAQIYINKDVSGSDKCAPLGFAADGKFFLTDNTYATFEAWNVEAAGQACVTQATIVAAEFIEDKLEANAACYAKDAKIGAAQFCGVATDGKCSATEVCVVDNQCKDSKCVEETRYVVTIAAGTENTEAAIKAAVQAALDAIEVGTETKTNPCKNTGTGDDAVVGASFTVISSEVTQNWVLAAIEPKAEACATAFETAVANFNKVQGSTCAACVAWTVNGYTDATCPCADPAEVITQAKYKLVEGKKLGDVETFYKDAQKASKADCIVAFAVVPSANSTFVLQVVQKYKNETCTKEADESKQGDEFKKIATQVTDFKIVVKATVEDCVADGKIKCVATEAKCATIVCGKGAACTTENQADVCATGQCVEAKCNSASVVGYVVAVVAVIAAFVF